MLIKQSESTAARRTIYFTAVETDDTSYESTLSGADIRISKAGGSEADSLGTATHIATGLFKYVFDTTEVDTVGEVSVRLAKSGVYNDVRVVNIVAFDPYSASSLGLTNLDATVSGVSAALLATALETGVSVELLLRLAGAVGGAKRTLSGTTFTLRDVADETDLVVATVDGSGNVTAVTITE